MPVIPPSYYGYGAEGLYRRGRDRLEAFCTANGIQTPHLGDPVPLGDWHVMACAYYRPGVGIRICLPECARVARETWYRNWNWPGSTTDREPYGVICHELGHHCDWITGKKKWEYGSEYCVKVMELSREAPVTSYAETNPAEWFAEAFRLFVTNPALLALIRPRTFEILMTRWIPVGSDDWVKELGDAVPDRILKNLHNKVKRGY